MWEDRGHVAKTPLLFNQRGSDDRNADRPKEWVKASKQNAVRHNAETQSSAPHALVSSDVPVPETSIIPLLVFVK